MLVEERKLRNTKSYRDYILKPRKVRKHEKLKVTPPRVLRVIKDCLELQVRRGAFLFTCGGT
ncbi:hypothetical protein E2C01_073794 [Portunus trituberculatus]|uniref:Uncharacterized protein n=1 Tax=Portunus trituberculatus TaxID=210409 RepID=A0A5B7IBI1_PORTR|nr:hypothetical protein [Portunus trituberculatus]